MDFGISAAMEIANKLLGMYISSTDPVRQRKEIILKLQNKIIDTNAKIEKTNNQIKLYLNQGKVKKVVQYTVYRNDLIEKREQYKKALNLIIKKDKEQK